MGTKISCPGQKQSLEQLEWGFGVPDRQIKDSSMHRGDSKGKETFPLHPQPPARLGLGSPAHLWLSLLCCASKSLWPLSPSALNLILAVFPVVIELH